MKHTSVVAVALFAGADAVSVSACGSCRQWGILYPTDVPFVQGGYCVNDGHMCGISAQNGSTLCYGTAYTAAKNPPASWMFMNLTCLDGAGCGILFNNSGELAKTPHQRAKATLQLSFN